MPSIPRVALLPLHRSPTHPGEMLLEEFLKPLKRPVRDAARAAGIPYKALKSVVAGKARLTDDHAARLATYTGMSVDFWQGLQRNYDAWINSRPRR